MQTKNKLVRTLVVVFALVLLAGFVIYSQSNGTIRVMSGTKSNACINNLRQIDGAIQQWALENKKPPTAPVTLSDISSYLKTPPVCPSAGNSGTFATSYTVRDVSSKPSCLINTNHDAP